MNREELSLTLILLAWATGYIAGALITVMNTGSFKREEMGKQQTG